MNSTKQGITVKSVAYGTLFLRHRWLRENTDLVCSNQQMRPTAPSVRCSCWDYYHLFDAACAFRAEEMPSLISCRMAAKVMAGVSDVDVLLGGILSTK
ncbi:hypothetical protein Tco_0561276 [Tanacetum coccineum]